MTTGERLLKHVSKSEEGCWLWQGCRNSKGYGLIKIERKYRRAHRVSFVLAGGIIPEKWEIDHLCFVRRCVNPAHLRVVPPGFNGLQGNARTAQKLLSRTHCRHGHEYTDANTGRNTGNARRCRTCCRDQERARYQQRKIYDGKEAGS